MGTASAFDKGNEGLARWSLRLLGGFELTERPGGERVTALGKRERVLLAFLALSPKNTQQRRKLAALLWGDATDETLLDNLRTCVWSLRKALGDAEHRFVVSEGEDLALGAGAFEVDALAFRRLAAQSGRAELEDAAKLYAGEFLDGLEIEGDEFESWRREEATRFRDQAIDVLSRLMTQLSESGETDRAIEVGQRILRLEPLHEPAVRRLMRLYGESGRRGPAILLYRALADALRTELDAQPDAETRAVFAEISRGSEDTTAPAATADANSPAPSSSVARESLPLPAPHIAAAAAEPRQAQTHNRSWILAGGLAAALIATVLLYQVVAPAGTTTAQKTGVEAAKAAASSRVGVISVAVLPFDNISGDASQVFFSDGITEEIVTALAKIPDLRVVARSSASQFKGERRDMRAVGQALGATHLLEGSVRNDGTRVRITAQLVKADDGVNVWVSSYDRDLTDVFAIQEEIATSIAGALRMPLGLNPGERLISNRNIDTESYQQFLRARQLRRALQDGVPEAIRILEPLVVRNPDFAPAWALLASCYQYAGFQFGRRNEEFVQKAEMAARRAIELDPNNADGYSALGVLERVRGNILAADDLFSKALALDPNNTDTLVRYMILLSVVDRRMEALAMALQLRALEPYVPSFSWQVAEMQWENGQDAAAIEILQSLPDQPPARVSLAMIYASQGRYKEAADSLAAVSGTGRPAPPRVEDRLRAAEALLRTAPTKTASPQNLPGDLAVMGFAYLYVGAPERVLEHYESTLESGVVGGQGGDIGFLWHPSFAPVRKLERFKTFVSKTGLVEYWRAKGWPEACRPTSADDFACT